VQTNQPSSLDSNARSESSMDDDIDRNFDSSDDGDLFEGGDLFEVIHRGRWFAEKLVSWELSPNYSKRQTRVLSKSVCYDFGYI